MKSYVVTLFIYWICIWSATAEILDCFGHQCGGHSSLCLVNKEHTFSGKCVNQEHCRHHSRCTAGHEGHGPGHEVHGPGHECCCEDQQCIDSLRDVYTGTIINCFGKRCDEHHSMCVIEREHGRLSGWCDGPDHHHHYSACTTTHVHAHVNDHDYECRCMNQQCIDGLMPPLLNCLGKICTGNHPNCEIHKENGHLVGHCIEERQCTEHHRGICTGEHDTHGHGGCCCQDDKCVATVTVITTSAPLTNAPTTKVDAVTTDATTSASNTTTEYQISITTVPIVTDSSTTATPNVLHCPTCTDDFVADCQQNAECTADEACMLQVTEGQLQTGCVEITDCEYNARIGTSICCKDKNCTDNAFRNFHDFIFTCPTCQNTPDPKSCMDTQWKCAYMNKGCMISLTTRGFTSGCNTNGTDCHQAQAANSALCNINPIPFGFNPDLQCSFCCHQNENTCIVNALGIHEITTPPEVTGSAVGSACFDIEDDTFNCKMFNTTYDLCAQTSGLLGHLVVTKCRKTCGVCTDGSLTTEGVSVATTGISVTNEGVSVAMTTTSGSVTTESVSVAMTTTNDSLTTEGVNVTMPTTSGSVTTEGVAMTTVSSPQPTTPMPCIDHDVNNNCDLMRDVLCHANDPHIMNYAVATCAETCDLCAEYLQHLSGLVVTP